MTAFSVIAVVQSQQLASALGGPILLSKGPQDIITDGQLLLKVDAAGSPRRCGGQGDVLTGASIWSALQSTWSSAMMCNKVLGKCGTLVAAFMVSALELSMLWVV
jgi:NAD(P)H-hydrate repair Nnr-like enzyme with NAD(P)H-hydrate dehydratase domain